MFTAWLPTSGQFWPILSLHTHPSWLGEYVVSAVDHCDGPGLSGGSTFRHHSPSSSIVGRFTVPLKSKLPVRRVSGATRFASRATQIANVSSLNVLCMCANFCALKRGVKDEV